MATSGTIHQTPVAARQLGPAIPTDTNGILLRLLVMAEEARRENLTSADRPIIPRGVITMLLRAMKVRDPAIVSHSQRIAAIASGVAGNLGWNDEQRRYLELAALVHDLGKVSVPDHILRKPGKLSTEEYDLVLQHHHAAVNLLQALHTDVSVINMLLMLHHSFDGGSRQIEGDGVAQDLPLGARILAVADAYDSLSSPKSYRRGMTHAETMSVLEEKAGSRYDGSVVRILGRWIETDGEALLRHVEPFQSQSQGQSHQMSAEECIDIVVLTQILSVLHQFQQLYDGYVIVDDNENYCIWSDGMPALTGLPIESVLGRTWQPSDIQLRPITGDDAVPELREETIVGQVIRNGRAQFASRACQASESRHLKVDVYTAPIPMPGGKQHGVVQLLRNKSGVRRQSREYVELKLAATRDSLTGVNNRGQLETQLRHLLEEYHNTEGTGYLSVIFLDVDRFKSINDNFGHHVGDQVLVDLTRLLQHETYSGEIIGRYGGEEFVVICPDTDLEATVRRAERLRHAIMKSSIGGVSTLNVTSSFGCSTAALGDTVQTLLERADNCLYRAKETGRNKTCWEGQEQETRPEPAQPAEVITDTPDPSPFSFQDCIEVSTSLELTGMKLKAFLKEHAVRILSQDQATLKFREGSLGLIDSHWK
ncbi:MAG: diguanylate cyclase [Planctomycetaceae bacterium]|nr:diguanylate cyclase [Planctomycetaceae bacterium]